MFKHTGVVAGVIDIGASWLSDIKEGVCKDAFWLNKEQCCWSSNDTQLDEETCSQVCRHSLVSSDVCFAHKYYGLSLSVH